MNYRYAYSNTAARIHNLNLITAEQRKSCISCCSTLLSVTLNRGANAGGWGPGHPWYLTQSREWVTQSDPRPKWPIELLTHDPCDPWPMGHRGRHPILAQALHIFIDYPTLYLDIVYVHTPLSCYIIAHVSKLHIQAPVNLEFWYIIIATIYKPSHKVKKLMGHG